MKDSRGLVRCVLLVLAVAVAAVISACGSSDDTGGTSAATEATGTEATSTEAEDVYFLLPSLQDEGRIRWKEGAEAYASEHDDVDLTIDAGATLNGDAGELVSKVETELLKEPDVIIVEAGAVPDQLQPILEKAIDEGIKVVTLGVEIPGLKGVSTFVGLDDEQASATAGEYLSKEFPKGGEIGIVSCIVNNPVTIARTKGFEAGLASNIKVGPVVDPKCDVAKAQSMTENMITTNPDLIAIYATVDDPALGAQKAVEASGKDIQVFGHDGNQAARESIENGGLRGTVEYPFEDSGAAAVEAAVGAGEGKTLPPQILVKSGLITKENVSEAAGG